MTVTQQAPGTCFSYTYCIALLIGDRVELSAIVERGVNPTPLVCRLPEWPETAGRMQGEQQQSREQRREEEKIKGENKRVGNNTVRTAVRPEERPGLSAGAPCWYLPVPCHQQLALHPAPGRMAQPPPLQDRCEGFAGAPCHSINPEKPGDMGSHLPRGSDGALHSCYPLPAPNPTS